MKLLNKILPTENSLRLNALQPQQAQNKSELYDFVYLQQNAFDAEDAYCPIERQIPVYMLLSRIFETEFSFATHDEARSFFLELQNKLKNMNYLPFKSAEYQSAYAEVEKMVAR